MGQVGPAVAVAVAGHQGDKTGDSQGHSKETTLELRPCLEAADERALGRLDRCH